MEINRWEHFFGAVMQGILSGVPMNDEFTEEDKRYVKTLVNVCSFIATEMTREAGSKTTVERLEEKK